MRPTAGRAKNSTAPRTLFALSLARAGFEPRCGRAIIEQFGKPRWYEQYIVYDRRTERLKTGADQFYEEITPSARRVFRPTNHFSLLIQTQRNQKIDRVLQRLVLQLRLAGLAGFLLFVGIEFRVSAVSQGRFI